MQPKRALVLSSGGGKGAFQVGAEKYLHEVKGYEWTVISGVSIGALNGAFIAMNRRDRCEELWGTVTPDWVYGRRSTLGAAARLISKRSSLFGSDTLRKVVAEIDPKVMTCELMVGAVSLTTGEFVTFTKDHPDFLNAVMASAALPMIFPPVHVSDAHPSMVDGAVRNITPVSSVFQHQPDEIVVINCSSNSGLAIPNPPMRVISITQRSIEIMMQEVFHNDIGRVQQINSLVAQATAQGATLKNLSGRTLRQFPLILIEPDERIGGRTTYTKAQSKRAFEAGYEKAKQVVP